MAADRRHHLLAIDRQELCGKIVESRDILAGRERRDQLACDPGIGGQADPVGPGESLPLVGQLVFARAFRGVARDHRTAQGHRTVEVFRRHTEKGRPRPRQLEGAEEPAVNAVGQTFTVAYLEAEPPKQDFFHGLSGPADGRAAGFFLFGCLTREYFADKLRKSSVVELASTRSLMAPEAYLTEALVEGLAAAEGAEAIRGRVVAAYARYQKITGKAAGTVFAPAVTGTD